MSAIRLFALALLFGLANPARAELVTVGVSDGNAGVLDIVDGRFAGTLANLYQCAFDGVDLEIEFRRYPHARILHNLETGEIDVGLPLVKVSDRDLYAVFPRGLLQVKFLLYSRQKIDPDTDLAGFAFTVRRATASKDLVIDRGGRYEEVSDWEQAVKLAQIGRFDGVVIPELIANGIPAENYEGMRRALFGSVPLALYVSKQSPRRDDLVARFDRAIADYSKAIEINPKRSAKIYKNRAYIQEKLGKNQKAKDDLKNYLKLSPKAADRGLIEQAIREL